MTTFDKWYQKPETKAQLASAKKKAWDQFTKQFPNADKNQFYVQTSVDDKYRITAEVFFRESAEYSSSVFGSERKYWSKKKKTALGLIGLEGFPFQLSPLKTQTALPIPAVEFTESAPSIAKIFNQNRIYATPDEFFATKFRDIFQQTRLEHTTAAEAKTWLRAPNMKYWSQQLSFAVFCATQGCGISREIFDSGFSLAPQIRAFYQFHVYFTIRRILYQLGGIQNMSALPGDPTFSQFNNHYDAPSYKRICAEFGIDPSSDFRFTHGKNGGLGYVYVYAQGASKTEYAYPGWNKFSDEGGKALDGNLIYYIEPDVSTQYDWFAPKTAAGLTQAGLSRINQSIEAYVYCILGAQVNVRSSILGEGGRAKEAQTEFLTLMEDSIRQPDLAKSVQRYLSLSCFLHLLWENRAFDLSPPTRSVSCSSSSFAPGGETHLLPFSFYCSSPCYLWPSSGPLPFWCPGQSNAWILLVVHAQHMPYPAPPPSPDLFADGTSSSSSPDFLI